MTDRSPLNLLRGSRLVSIVGPIGRCAFDPLERAYAHVDRLSADLCRHVAAELPLLSAEPRSFETIATAARVVGQGHYLLQAILDLLTEDGLAAYSPEGWRAAAPLPPDRSADLLQAALEECPTASSTFLLLDRCRRDAVPFLSGATDGLQTIFPRGDLSLWTDLHDRDVVMSCYADLIPPALEGLLNPGAQVLEIGAGVGAVLRRCRPLVEQRVARYWFTDRGQVFLARARATYRGMPTVAVAPFDLNRSPGAQGWGAVRPDCIVGVNVLHVAVDLPQTIAWLYEMLPTSGCLLLAEGSPPARGRRWRLDPLFAFLRGWWDVRLDAELRPRAGFLFPSEWSHLLSRGGFRMVTCLPGDLVRPEPDRGGLIAAFKYEQRSWP